MPSTSTLYRAAMLPGNDLGNATAETQLPNGRGVPFTLTLPSNGSLANRSFRLRAYGRVATTATTSLTLQVYFGMSPVIANNTLIFNTGAQLVDTVKSNWELWIDLSWDSDSKSINGRGEGQLANNILGPQTLLNVPLAADPNRDSNTFLQSGPTYGFTITGFFANSSTGNHAFVDLLALEEV
jgi:hypothetical protein